MNISLKEWVKKVMSYVTAPKYLIVRRQFTFQNTTYMSWSCPSIAGYKCVGIVGYTAGGSTSATTGAFDMYVDESNQIIHVSNAVTSSSSYNVLLTLLYIADIVGGGTA